MMEMKSLDELITNMETYPVAGNTTMTSAVCIVLREDIDDCVKYLKQYQDILSGKDSDLSENNKRLTWEELKQLEGEPVWIEEKSVGRGYWAIVSNIRNSYFGPCVDLATKTGWKGFNIYDRFEAYRKKPKEN